MYMYNIFCMYAGGVSAQVVGILGSQIQGPKSRGWGHQWNWGGSTMLWSGDIDMVVFLPSHEWEDLQLTSCFIYDSSWLGISAKVFLA